MNTKTLALALGMIGAATFAAEKEVELPTIIVEASRIDSSAAEIPANVQVITREEIASSGAGTVPELLEKKSTALHIHGLGGTNPALKQISMGGYGENGFGRVVILIDGERINNPDMMAPNLAQIPLGAIERIEVLTGSQAVLHGDGASAGMINIITIPDEADEGVHGHAEVHGGSWNTIGTSAGVRGNLDEGLFRYWGNGGWDHSDGYRENSGYDIYNLNGGIQQGWNNGSYLRLSVFHSDADYELPGALSKEEWKAHPTDSHSWNRDDFYRRISYGLNTTLNAKINDENTFRLIGTASHRTMKSLTTSEYWGTTYPWRVEYDMYSYELTPEWINTTELFGLENEFIFGATYRYDRNHARSGDYSWTKYEINRQSFGLFAQNTLHLTDDLAFQVGGRYERAYLDGKKYIYGPDNKNVHLYAADIALLYSPIEDLKTYVRLSRHFRTPFIDENSGKILNPETGFTADVGADYTFLEEFNIGSNLYYSKLKHEIFYNPLLGWGTNVNSPDDTIREGFNAHLAWEREKVAGLTLAYSYTQAEFEEGQYKGNKIPLVPTSTVSLNGRVWIWDECYIFGGYRYVSYQYCISDFSNSSPTIPAYGIFHLGAEYAPSLAIVKGLKLGITIDNLFNKNYCDYATYGTNYYPAAERSYMFRIGFDF